LPVPSSSTSNVDDKGNPEAGDNNGSRVAVPVEITGGDVGFTPEGSFSGGFGTD